MEVPVNDFPSESGFQLIFSIAKKIKKMTDGQPKFYKTMDEFAQPPLTISII
jgi:hypothetical protein